ncbi:MAG: flavodoxin-dependent (E)-4-hydroxy-3-methylbut-2-enyl-diphosphate synthase [Lachnospiraceae bacterium]|nr:flavodoxin-dependent (E)-4-hydroxy-3-methylbut-2-enyl-diphosphate synthase [Lachnospiraceae bacterium]
MEEFIKRKCTCPVKIGNIEIGGGNPIAIQSMCNTDTRDISATIAQINELKRAGCEIVRVAVPDIDAAKAIGKIKENTDIPLVADIHFDYKLALRTMDEGVDKIRINPGNIGDIQKVKEVTKKAAFLGIPIRIGVNSGSLEKELLAKYGRVTPEALVESALNNVKILEDQDFYNIVVSIKASSVPFSIKAYSELCEKINYPLHIGITEAGTSFSGSIKSAVGIGALLSMGIGDTIRVSLTADPVSEIAVAKEILKALGLRKFGAEIISCPTCGRTEIDLISIAKEVEIRAAGIEKNIKIAVMGCAVNGPGEAREADIGIAGGKGEGLIFRKGKIIKKVPENELVSELMKEIEKIL